MRGDRRDVRREVCEGTGGSVRRVKLCPNVMPQSCLSVTGEKYSKSREVIITFKNVYMCLFSFHIVVLVLV